MPFDFSPTETNTVADTLRRARALIDTPEKWCQNEHQIGHAYCVEAALNIVWRGDVLGSIFDSCPAWKLLQDATGVQKLFDWNDAPERTHAEVLAAFDKAIALAESGA